MAAGTRSCTRPRACPRPRPSSTSAPPARPLGLPLDDTLKKIYFVEDMELSPLACAYARARGADRMSSFGDWIALSDECDEATAKAHPARGVRRRHRAGLYRRRAGHPEDQAQGRLQHCRASTRSYQPAPVEHKDVFGITFEQGRNELKYRRRYVLQISSHENRDAARRAEAGPDRCALIALKYTQSNSVCYAQGGQAHRRGRGPAEPHPLHPPCGQQSGHLAPAPAPQGAGPAVPSRRLAAPTATTPSTCISPTNAEDVLGDGVWAADLHHTSRAA